MAKMTMDLLLYYRDMVKKLESQDQLANLVFELSGETRGPDRHVVRAIGYQIRSNARLEDSIDKFAKSTTKTENKMHDLSRAQIKLAWAQVILAIASIVSAIIIAQ